VEVAKEETKTPEEAASTTDTETKTKGEEVKEEEKVEGIQGWFSSLFGRKKK